MAYAMFYAIAAGLILVAFAVKKGIHRDCDDDVIGGVCSGIANHFGWDVVLVRVITAILIMTTVFPVVPYLLMWLMLDEEQPSPVRRALKRLRRWNRK